MIKRLLFLVVLVAVLLAGGAGYYAMHPLTLPAQPFEFSLKQGSSLKAVARQLREAGLLSSETPFVLLGRIFGHTTRIKAGNYALDSSITPLQLLDMLTKGRVSLSEVSVIEGWTFGQFRAALNANPALRHDSAAMSDTEILQRIGAGETQAEGLFYPDTYYFANGSSDLVLLKRAYRLMQQHLDEAWQKRDPAVPLESPYQALILASIVEKETGKASDRDMIAGVFVNRLRRGMLLQTDPTVIYGMEATFDGNLRKRDLQTDTPYNTYTRPGLTPTPIALPGLGALNAALHPARTDALYFVARGDGSSQFSATLEAHNRAVNKYQK